VTSNADAPFPIRLATLQWGEPDARPAALLLHGLTSAGGTWWQVASALAAAGWSVTAPDLRGHGASPRTPSYRLADYAADVLALAPPPRLASAAPAPVPRPWDLVIGHSLGGAVATVAAEARPGWADALLLLDPVLSMPDEQHDDVIAELLGDLDRLDAGELLRANPRWHTEDAVQKVNAARVVSAFVVERTVRDNEGWYLEPAVAGIREPVRVLGADPQQGASFTASEGERLSKAAPGTFSSAIVDDAGHSIQRDDPERVVAEALARLAP
jgi:pimeloyl-ACP methyl ester carboxylesterase